MIERVVYFIRPIGMDGPIKIGCSREPEDRVRSLMAWSPFKLEVVATAIGDFTLEGRIHRRFRSAHSHAEWFSPAPELLIAIERLQAGLPVEEAIDFGNTPPAAKRPERIWVGRRRNYLSYRHKLRHAVRKANDSRPAEANYLCSLPPDVEAIIADWSERRGPDAVDPDAQTLRRLDEVIADPLTHCEREIMSWLPRRSAA